MSIDVGSCPVEIDLILSAYDGPLWEIAPFRHRSGWLLVSEARLEMSFAISRKTLVAAISDHGEMFPSHIAMRLMNVPASFPRDAEIPPPSELEEAMDVLYWDFLGTTDLNNLYLLQEAEERTTEKVRIFEAECANFETKLQSKIRTLRAEKRLEGIGHRRIEIDAHLKRLSEMLEQLALGMRLKTTEIRRETEDLESAVFESLTDMGEIEHQYVVRWCAQSRVTRRTDIYLPGIREMNIFRTSLNSAIAGSTLERVAEMRIFKNDWDQE